jgi:peptide-methionine (S)-S-oxide reductase
MRQTYGFSHRATSKVNLLLGLLFSLHANRGSIMSERATLGGGCFWCLEATYQLIEGVEKVVPGYAGGTSKNPSYWTIHGGDSGHAEVVQITFDPHVISYKDILDIFWAIHDPTTLNRQGNDIGAEYRSIILYHNDRQRKEAEASRSEAQKLWNEPIVTEIVPLETFYEAEAEHHNFFQNNPTQAYCQLIINPKLEKLRTKFATKLKKA